MEGLVHICRPPYSMHNEDTDNYDVGWTELPAQAENSTPVMTIYVV